MFVAPTMTYFSTGEASTAWWNATSTAQASGASSSINAGSSGLLINNGGTGNDATGDILEIQYTAEGEM
jgi:hypothetical protein